MLFKPLSDSIYDLWQNGMPVHRIADVLGVEIRKVEQEVYTILHNWSRDELGYDDVENG